MFHAYCVQNVQEEEEKRATWKRCRPTVNGVPPSLYSAFMGRDNKVTLCSTQDCVALMDSEYWVPELSPEGFVGLYHHWDTSKNKLTLYMVIFFLSLFSFCVL